ncbi:VOC family protein [Conexibacter sp. JD483]|uniref:VOC family protein n=1 Tax=unclassified Conexibacter TaxID=2627773 RepID=UPI0027286B4D|nr:MULTISPECIES: VOC family protein [unclassified Conexibacter]MDO8185247.1 VOC family protein [Conexibacter sp. CPCC 205706]MDO8198293.1 VOC family protein [Conexibacter sp. CPCC 205762]MDR9367746.1 VOC family protein [Conexibacter sp. JD483]
MKLEGLHHITMITGDAQKNVAFYADTLGLRLVKKTVNFDQPEAYHLYFGDETGAPGSILTWFEFAGAQRGRAGLGMVHTLQLGVPSAAAIDFWEQRLRDAGSASERTANGTLAFEDYDGLGLELVVSDDGNPPLQAVHPEVPAEHAIVGLEGARAYSLYANVEESLLTDVLGFDYEGGGEYKLQGEQRHFHWAYDQAEEVGEAGAGTVHHIAWASQDDDHLKWQARVREAGGFVTDVRDRDYFNAIYFREPRGILFEIATLSPGFAADEDPQTLGEALRLPKQHEHLRAHLEQTLQPVVNPRTARREAGATR